MRGKGVSLLGHVAHCGVDGLLENGVPLLEGVLLALQAVEPDIHHLDGLVHIRFQCVDVVDLDEKGACGLVNCACALVQFLFGPDELAPLGVHLDLLGGHSLKLLLHLLELGDLILKLGADSVHDLTLVR